MPRIIDQYGLERRVPENGGAYVAALKRGRGVLNEFLY